MIAGQFVRAGFAFLKFNFSHNGTTPDHPQDFVDLEAFGNNNYTKQLFDLGKVLALHDANPGAQLLLTPGDHVFDRKHPWERDGLPYAMQSVVDSNARFFREALMEGDF